MQDFTGVPAVVDLAAMRDAMGDLGGDPTRINPLVPAELVIDHSVLVDVFGRPDAFARNAELEFERNRERYQFLRWGQQAFADFRVVPPDHRHLPPGQPRVPGQGGRHRRRRPAYPDTLVGTDSHTPMVNGLGVVGWGVGGIEAEAAMLGQPISMLIPKVVGFKLSGELPEGATATDLVLTVTELLRRHGVVGKFVEFYGPGVANVPVENRATIGNMSPEYGSTITIFPIDDETLRYLRFTGRPPELVALVEAYAKEQGLWHDPAAEPRFSETLELDLSTVVPSLAGPRRPQDRVAAHARPSSGFRGRPRPTWPEPRRGTAPAGARRSTDGPRRGRRPSRSRPATRRPPWPGRRRTQPRPRAGRLVRARPDRGQRPARASACRSTAARTGARFDLDHGHVVIAAITSCTNTSNPPVMVAAGLLARKAVERGLDRQAVGQDLAGPRVQGGHRLPTSGPGCCPTSRSSASTWSASAAPPASATPGPCPRDRRRTVERARPGGGVGAVGQPQLRGPHQPRRAA